jgi:hypothetical protein
VTELPPCLCGDYNHSEMECIDAPLCGACDHPYYEHGFDGACYHSERNPAQPGEIIATMSLCGCDNYKETATP